MNARIAVLVLVCLAAAACSGPTALAPSGFPARPLDVVVAELDPCATLSDDQTRTLGATDPERRTVRVGNLPSDACVWLSDTDLGYGVQTIPTGADVAKTEPGSSIIEVNGFGAVRSVVRQMTGGAPTCQVTVDAGPVQSIRVQAQGTGERPRTDEEMCRIATDVTGMVMTTVVATARR